MAHQGSTFLDYFNVLRRRKWIVLQAMILVPLLAILITASQDEQWETQTKVALDREGLADALTGVTTDPGVDEFNQTLNGEAVAAKSSAVAQRVADEYDPPLSRDDFTDDTDVTVDERASLLVFHGRGEDEEAATRLATVHADAYLANRRALATRRYRQAVDELDTQIAQLEDQGGQTEALRESLNEQRDRLQVLQALASAQGSIVDTTEAEKIRPKPVRNIILGIVLGAIVGALLAFAVEAFDRRLRRVEDVERSTGLRLLGQIPELGRQRTAPERLVMSTGDPAEAVDAFRALRASVDLAMDPTQTKTVMVTSSGPREGKTTVACNLAAAFAMSGRTVTLVDLDFRHSTAATVLGLDDTTGLSDIIIDGGDLDDVMLDVPLPAPGSAHGHRDQLLLDGTSEHVAPPGVQPVLRFLAAGRLAGVLSDTVSLGEVARHLAEVTRTADIVIVDAPPLFDATAVELTEHVDGLLIVARLGVVDRVAMSEARRLLSMSPAPALGMVVTSADRDPDGRVPSYSPVTRAPRKGVPSFK